MVDDKSSMILILSRGQWQMLSPSQSLRMPQVESDPAQDLPFDSIK